DEVDRGGERVDQPGVIDQQLRPFRRALDIVIAVGASADVGPGGAVDHHRTGADVDLVGGTPHRVRVGSGERTVGVGGGVGRGGDVRAAQARVLRAHPDHVALLVGGPGGPVL